jgi:hypothetical protein
MPDQVVCHDGHKTFRTNSDQVVRHNYVAPLIWQRPLKFANSLLYIVTIMYCTLTESNAHKILAYYSVDHTVQAIIKACPEETK